MYHCLINHKQTHEPCFNWLNQDNDNWSHRSATAQTIPWYLLKCLERFPILHLQRGTNEVSQLIIDHVSSIWLYSFFWEEKNIAYPLKVYSRVQWTKYETCSRLPRFHILYISSLINKHSLPIKSVQGMYQMRNLCNVAWVSYFVYLQQIQHIWIFSSFLEQPTQLTYWRC